MIKHGRFWFPSSDTHFKDRLNENGYYQEDTFIAGLEYCKQKRCFVDVGAHVGMWSVKAADVGFKTIYAYEPVIEHWKCYTRNLADIDCNVQLFNVMLGNGGVGKMEQFMAGNGGALKTVEGQGNTTIYRLDDIFPAEQPIDLMKLDVEGFEKNILEGGRELILRHKPVIVVEQKHNIDAIHYLKGLGAHFVKNVRKDYIFKWEK